MKTLDKNQFDIATNALLSGCGYYLFESVFEADEIQQAIEIIDRYSSVNRTATHFHGANTDKIQRQRRVWNLLNKGDVFSKMATHPAIMAVFSKILGKNFILGSFAANRLLPGAPAQEAHIDYPYWDMHDRDEFPARINASFHLNCQALINLHEFTNENGATAVVPYSQNTGIYPTLEEFNAHAIQLIAPPGSLLLFTGLIWHRAMANNSNEDRTSVLGQYLPKFVKPMENMIPNLNDVVINNADANLRQILGLDLRYPENLEDSNPGNAEGRTS